ncbi:MAG: helix-turn-helix domain-containing protein, partial [Gammaproteobacteria bacterium]|nr:helix-turn-helix domain-containing protein [Gammaproteobacteria bacterium]
MSSNAPGQNGFDAESPATGVGPGRALSEARMALGLSVEDVAAKLHLAASTVRALEADDYRGLPPAIFVRGYLKNLARLLDLDPIALVESYQQQAGRDATVEVSYATALGSVPEESRFSVLLMSLMIAAFLALGWWVYDAAVDSGGVPASATASPEPPKTPAPPAAEVATGGVPVASESGASGDAATPSLAPGPAAAAPAAVPPGGPAVVKVRFLGDSWVSVVDADGSRLVYELGSKGAEKLIRGKAPFTVVLGRPAEISLEYNEQP